MHTAHTSYYWKFSRCTTYTIEIMMVSSQSKKFYSSAFRSFERTNTICWLSWTMESNQSGGSYWCLLPQNVTKHCNISPEVWWKSTLYCQSYCVDMNYEHYLVLRPCTWSTSHNHETTQLAYSLQLSNNSPQCWICSVAATDVNCVSSFSFQPKDVHRWTPVSSGFQAPTHAVLR